VAISGIIAATVTGRVAGDIAFAVIRRS